MSAAHKSAQLNKIQMQVRKLKREHSLWQKIVFEGNSFQELGSADKNKLLNPLLLWKCNLWLVVALTKRRQTQFEKLSRCRLLDVEALQLVYRAVEMWVWSIRLEESARIHYRMRMHRQVPTLHCSKRGSVSVSVCSFSTMTCFPAKNSICKSVRSTKCRMDNQQSPAPPNLNVSQSVSRLYLLYCKTKCHIYI